MRLLLVMILALSTTVYGWSGVLANHVDEECHLDNGKHHDQEVAYHKDACEDACSVRSHETDSDCQPVAQNASFVASITDLNRPAALEKLPIPDREALSSIAERPDTPPPKT
jgi:hypothetical protein